MPELDPIDILLRIATLRKFVAETEVASSAVMKIGRAGAAASGESSAAAAAAAGKARAASLGLLTKVAKGSALAIAAIGFESSKLAINFDAEMTKISTQAGEASKNIGWMGEAVLGMAKKVGIGPQSLAEGLYHLVSIGLRGKVALSALAEAANLAALGGSNLEDTATALGGVFKTAIKGAGNFSEIVATMNATVGAGNMRMQDLVTALGTGVLPAAKIAGLSLQNVMGSLAMLNDLGWKGSSAMAQFATALHYLYDPTTKATKALAMMHLTGYQLEKTMRTKGLPAALSLLRDHLHAFSKDPNLQTKLIGSIIPGGRGRVLLASLNGINFLKEKEAFIKSHGTVANFTKGLALLHETAAFKIHAAWANVQANLIKIGKKLEPLVVHFAQALSALSDALIWMVTAVENAVKWWNNLSGPMKAILTVVGMFVAQAALFVTVIFVWEKLKLAITAAKLAMAAFSAVSKAALLTNPWTILIMAIIVIVVLLVKHWNDVKFVFEDIWKWIKANWPYLVAALGGPIIFAAVWVIKHWKEVSKFFEGLGKTIMNFGSEIGKAIAWPFEWAFEQVKKIFHDIMHIPVLGKVLSIAFKISPIGQAKAVIGFGEKLLGLASGGTITSPGSVMVGEHGPEILSLPRGAQVQPLGAGAGFGGMNPMPMFQVKSDVHIDGKHIAEAVNTFTANKLARK